MIIINKKLETVPKQVLLSSSNSMRCNIVLFSLLIQVVFLLSIVPEIESFSTTNTLQVSKRTTTTTTISKLYSLTATTNSRIKRQQICPTRFDAAAVSKSYPLLSLSSNSILSTTSLLSSSLSSSAAENKNDRFTTTMSMIRSKLCQIFRFVQQKQKGFLFVKSSSVNDTTIDMNNRNNKMMLLLQQQYHIIRYKVRRILVASCLIMAMMTSSIVVPMGSSIVWWLPQSISSVPVVHAASTSTTTTMQPQQTLSTNFIQKLYTTVTTTSPSVDTIINDYVTQYMFDDDSAMTGQNYDSFESTYREAYTDMISGKNANNHAATIREIAQSILSPDQVSTTSTSTTASSTSFGTTIARAINSIRSSITSSINIGSLLLTVVRTLQVKLNINELTAIAIISSLFVIGVPVSALFVGMIIGGISKRNMNTIMKQRYGDTYTVDATMKQEEIIEAPSDDDDDDDDNDDDNDDDDDDDDDDSNDK